MLQVLPYWPVGQKMSTPLSCIDPVYLITHTSHSWVCVVPVLSLSALHAVFVCSAADECETTRRSPVSVLLHSVTDKNIKINLLLIQLMGFSCLSSKTLTVSLCCCCSTQSCSFSVWFSLCIWEWDRKSVKYSVVELLRGSYHAFLII